ncbi:hypothetical protein [Eubacterium ramulus]|uniref:hypothetical protein n=1 Tax=Eubacterium ramulus TaxID=39490 RepID=UPI0015A7CF40|nr:hypothetical protein [Eubacterium ramulus]
MTNFWKLKDFRPFSVLYAYIDHKDYLADALFIQEQIQVRFLQEMVKEGTPYRIVFGKVRKKECERFEKVLEKLPDKMLLCGHTDYMDICKEITGVIQNGMEENVA